MGGGESTTAVHSNAQNRSKEERTGEKVVGGEGKYYGRVGKCAVKQAAGAKILLQAGSLNGMAMHRLKVWKSAVHSSR